MENLYPKHGLVSRTYSKNSLIMASIFGSKSESFMTMSIPSRDEPLTNRPMGISLSRQATTLPQDVPSTPDRRLIELENQVQRLMEAYLALTQLTQVNKITTSCEICNGPHDTPFHNVQRPRACKENDEIETDMEAEEVIKEEESEFKTDGEVKEVFEEEEDDEDDESFNSFPTMKLVLEWEEKIKLHLEREMQFNQWRRNFFKGKHPTLIATKEGMDYEGEVT
ncbi:hypothetical protein Tco_0461648 [Tanacetum coccineum]